MIEFGGMLFGLSILVAVFLSWYQIFFGNEVIEYMISKAFIVSQYDPMASIEKAIDRKKQNSRLSYDKQQASSDAPNTKTETSDTLNPTKTNLLNETHELSEKK